MKRLTVCTENQRNFKIIYTLTVKFPSVLNSVFLQAFGTAGVLHQAQVQPPRGAVRLPRRSLWCHLPRHVHSASERPWGNVWVSPSVTKSATSYFVTGTGWFLFSGNEGPVSLLCGQVWSFPWIHRLVHSVLWESGGRRRSGGAEHWAQRRVKAWNAR